ncbi:hypothetical protein Leryth_027495 [Lithospermum erythrorhizon]|nr:hypothetical protein Leryth_027495 [Lithospermum erythrorhizon]
MGLLMPVGVLAMRIPNRKQHPARAKAIFYLHVTLQVTCVLLATTGAILSIRDFENSFNNIHQRLGLALYFLVGFQAFSGIFRPHRKKR